MSDRQPITRDNLADMLRERAPVAIGDGPDATKNAAVKIVRKIAPLFRYHQHHSQPNSFDAFKVEKAMAKDWLPRCGQAISKDDLYDLIEAERERFEAARNAEDAAKRERRQAAEKAAEANAIRRRKEERRREAEEEAKTKARLARTEKIKEAAEVLSCSTRYVRMILAEKTTLRSLAETMAGLFGGDPSEYLKPRGRSGRNPNLVAILLRPYVEGASFGDFISDPPELAGAALELRDAIANDGGMPAHVRQLESLTEFAQSAGIDAAAAVDLWATYKPWRIERVTAAALDEVGDPYDFG